MGNYVWETVGFQNIPLFQMKEEIFQEVHAPHMGPLTHQSTSLKHRSIGTGALEQQELAPVPQSGTAEPTHNNHNIYCEAWSRRP